MPLNRFIRICLLAVICLSESAWAQTFSVALLEDTRGAEAADLSNAVLNGCMDRLFRAGFIATSEVIRRVDRAEFQSRTLGIETARAGYVDYIALVWIRYAESPADPSVRMPELVYWRLVRVKSGDALAEGSTPPPLFRAETGDERREVLSDMGRSLADVWTKALSKERG